MSQKVFGYNKERKDSSARLLARTFFAGLVIALAFIFLGIGTKTLVLISIAHWPWIAAVLFGVYFFRGILKRRRIHRI